MSSDNWRFVLESDRSGDRDREGQTHFRKTFTEYSAFSTDDYGWTAMVMMMVVAAEVVVAGIGCVCVCVGRAVLMLCVM